MITGDIKCGGCGYEGKVEANDTVREHPEESLFKLIGKDPEGYIHVKCPKCQDDLTIDSSKGFFSGKITGVSKKKSEDSQKTNNEISDTDVLFCPSCFTDNKPNTIFCENCGNRLI